jgi:hypothetical protein
LRATEAEDMPAEETDAEVAFELLRPLEAPLSPDDEAAAEPSHARHSGLSP